MVVTVAQCSCGVHFEGVFQLHFVPPEIEYKMIDHGVERHLAQGHEITFLKTGRMTFLD